MSSVQDIMVGSALLSNFVNFSLHVLPPYYNQIISKLSHPNSKIASGISNAVFKLMENYPNETFSKSLTTINPQTAETRKRAEIIVSNLSFDNKVLLSNV